MKKHVNCTIEIPYSRNSKWAAIKFRRCLLAAFMLSVCLLTSSCGATTSRLDATDLIDEAQSMFYCPPVDWSMTQEQADEALGVELSKIDISNKGILSKLHGASIEFTIDGEVYKGILQYHSDDSRTYKMIHLVIKGVEDVAAVQDKLLDEMLAIYGYPQGWTASANERRDNVAWIRFFDDGGHTALNLFTHSEGNHAYYENTISIEIMYEVG